MAKKKKSSNLGKILYFAAVVLGVVAVVMLFVMALNSCCCVRFTLTEYFERCASVQFTRTECFVHAFLVFSLSFFLDSRQTCFIWRLLVSYLFIEKPLHNQNKKPIGQ